MKNCLKMILLSLFAVIWKVQVKWVWVMKAKKKKTIVLSFVTPQAHRLLDTDTRRRAAADLVRGLLEQFGKEVTEIFGNYVNAYLTVKQNNSLRS